MIQKRKPALLILTSSFPRAADDQTCGYVREFARRLAGEYEVTVLAPFDHQANDGRQPEFTLVRSKSFLPASLDPFRGSGDLNELIARGFATKLFFLISLLSFFVSAFRLGFRADVVCSHWMLPSGLIGACVARLFNKPHFIVEHSGALHLLRRMRLGRWLGRFLVSSSQRIVVVSKDLEEKLLALCSTAKGKIEILPMGVLTSDFKRCTISRKPAVKERTGSYTLLFIGRLVKIKGLDVLLKALTNLPNIHLLVAGEGENRLAYEARARHLQINATFFGQVGQADKIRLFELCDAVIIPSLILPDGRTEGMPVVALEAMATGKPLIASRVGGLTDIIKDGHNGLLFEAGNSQALAEKIKLLFADCNLQQTISNNSQQTVASFDWQVIGIRFGKIIEDLLRTNGSIAGYQSTRPANH